jgi:hypothetical protein
MHFDAQVIVSGLSTPEVLTTKGIENWARYVLPAEHNVIDGPLLINSVT